MSLSLSVTFVYVYISAICLSKSFLFYKGVLGQHHRHVTATHVRTAACAMTFGLTIFVSAKALLLEAIVPKVKILFNVQDGFFIDFRLNFNTFSPPCSFFLNRTVRGACIEI